MDNNVLKKLQEVETEILVVVDRFCREHNIDYSLYAGTALGAVRHGGFIPWDDDIDICMDRNAYNRFLELWRTYPVAGFTLAGDDEDDCKINHTKILKNGTILSSHGDMLKPIPHEIWLDIFAMDKVPIESKSRRKLLKAAKLRLVYTRDYPYSNGGFLLNVASRLLLAKPKKIKQKLKKKYDMLVTKYKDLPDAFSYMDLSCPGALRYDNPSNIFATEDIKFGSYTFMISKYSDQMLKIHYGDYMKLPPIEERKCYHSPDIIDFGER